MCVIVCVSIYIFLTSELIVNNTFICIFQICYFFNGDLGKPHQIRSCSYNKLPQHPDS